MAEEQLDQATKKSWYKTWWGITLIVIGLIIVVGAVLGEDEKQPAQTSQTSGEKGAPKDTQTETETETVPFKKITEDDPNSPIGQTQVAQEGADGVNEITYEVSGNQRTKISEKVLIVPRDEITRMGTMAQPIELSGNGQQATQKFNLDEGLSIIKLTHSGDSNFIVDVLDDKGEQVENLVNEIESFDGSKALGISDEGIYILDIAADGDWTISIE